MAEDFFGVGVAEPPEATPVEPPLKSTQPYNLLRPRRHSFPLLKNNPVTTTVISSPAARMLFYDIY